MSDVSQILSQIDSGDRAAAEQLLPLVYDELRKLATSRMSLENPGLTLQATALVHDAYIRLVDVEQAQGWDSRGHFLRLHLRPCVAFRWKIILAVKTIAAKNACAWNPLLRLLNVLGVDPIHPFTWPYQISTAIGHRWPSRHGFLHSICGTNRSNLEIKCQSGPKTMNGAASSRNGRNISDIPIGGRVVKLPFHVGVPKPV